MTEFDPAMMERLAKAHWRSICQQLGMSDEEAILASGDDWGQFVPEIRKMLALLPLPIAALNALEAGEATVVPADQVAHESSCARHNMPAYPNGRCDCAASPYTETKDG